MGIASTIFDHCKYDYSPDETRLYSGLDEASSAHNSNRRPQFGDCDPFDQSAIAANMYMQTTKMQNLETHITEILRGGFKQNRTAIPRDYFSWGRDRRHTVDDTERLPGLPSPQLLLTRIPAKAISAAIMITRSPALILWRFQKHYASFDRSYQLMSDRSSRELFAELILIKLLSEREMHLSAFTTEFVDSYEKASKEILASKETLRVYKWVLRKVTLTKPPISFYTVPTLLNLHYCGRLYRYEKDDVTIEVEGGDTVIDAGIGWGDTTVYLGALANAKTGGHLYAFDMLDEGMRALSEQCKLNPAIKNITTVLRAVSDADGQTVNISSPGPDAKIVDSQTKRKATTITIDTFSRQIGLKNVDFIKMDIEGAEIPALIGATATIKKFKPKLAISAYHKWDDLLTIPQLIHGMRDDYSFYLDCTTGFGGETVLYCR